MSEIYRYRDMDRLDTLRQINKKWYARLYTRLTGKPYATELDSEERYLCNLVGGECEEVVDRLRVACNHAFFDFTVYLDSRDLKHIAEWQPIR